LLFGIVDAPLDQSMTPKPIKAMLPSSCNGGDTTTNPTPISVPSIPEPIQAEITNFKFEVVETDGSFWTFSWRVASWRVAAKANRKVTCGLKIQWLNQRESELDFDFELVDLDRSVSRFTATDLIESGIAERVTQAQAVLESCYSEEDRKRAARQYMERVRQVQRLRWFFHSI
jgi:hypothetical protein